MKKLTGENSLFFKPTFEMRFCVLDLDRMVFRYAKSPKETFLNFQYHEIFSCMTEDPTRKNEIKLKNHNKNLADLKHLLFLQT